MARWWVVTPMFETVEAVPGFNGQGPTIEVCDCIEVEAETKRDAIRLGVAAMLRDKQHFEYCRDQRRDDASPYTGVYAEAADAQP